jgi:hypothetical protein
MSDLSQLSQERLSTLTHAPNGALHSSDLTWTESRTSDLLRERMLAPDPEPRSSPSSPTDNSSKRKRKRRSRSSVFEGGLIFAVLILLAAAGVVLAMATAPGKKSTSSQHAKVPPRNLSTAIYDRFDRADAAQAIGTSETGQAWTIVGAPWGVQDRQASIGAADSGKRTVAVIGLGTGDGNAQVTLTKVASGAGLVFRYRDAFNFWAITASPKFGTWNIVKVVNGQPTNIDNVGKASVDDNTTIAAKFQGNHIVFSLNGKEIKTLEDSTFATERYAGMVAVADDAHEARFDNFVGNVVRAQSSTASSTAPAPPAGAGISGVKSSTSSK